MIILLNFVRASRFRLGLASVCALGLLASAASCASGRDPGRGLLGNWGGPHVALTLTKTAGEIEYDCARGKITGPFLVDDKGRFDLMGTVVVGSVEEKFGGQEREKEGKEHPARFFGTTDGKTMTLKTLLIDRQQAVGPFTLSLGQKARLHKCMG